MLLLHYSVMCLMGLRVAMQVGLLEMRTMVFVEVREYSGQYILQDNPWLYTQWVQRAACQVAAALHAFFLHGVPCKYSTVLSLLFQPSAPAG